MLKIIVKCSSGLVRELSTKVGASLMQAVKSSGMEGIVAECGGSAMCATCHVYVDDAFLNKLVPPNAVELEMLESTACERTRNSRLSCQILMSEALGGIVVTLPERQV